MITIQFKATKRRDTVREQIQRALVQDFSDSIDKEIFHILERQKIFQIQYANIPQHNLIIPFKPKIIQFSLAIYTYKANIYMIINRTGIEIWNEKYINYMMNSSYN